MYNLVVDAGNSSVKMFLFDNGKIEHCIKCRELAEILPSIESIVPTESIGHCIVSSVSIEADDISAILRPYFPVIVFSVSLKLPILIKYSTPETLGSDRVAAVVGAVVRYPHRNLLVIDSGTAITYDIVTDKGEYLGGNISPGLKTRFRALHNFTGKLPLLQEDKSLCGLFGTNTIEALTIGIQNGMLYEVEGTIREFNHRFNDLLVVFTGGDSFFFENRINFNNFAEPYLVALGLNEILEHNV